MQESFRRVDGTLLYTDSGYAPFTAAMCSGLMNSEFKLSEAILTKCYIVHEQTGQAYTCENDATYEARFVGHPCPAVVDWSNIGKAIHNSICSNNANEPNDEGARVSTDENTQRTAHACKKQNSKTEKFKTHLEIELTVSSQLLSKDVIRGK